MFHQINELMVLGMHPAIQYPRRSQIRPLRQVTRARLIVRDPPPRPLDPVLQRSAVIAPEVLTINEFSCQSAAARDRVLPVRVRAIRGGFCGYTRCQGAAMQIRFKGGVGTFASTGAA